MSSSNCNCGRMTYNLVFSCSGAADVGAITDQTARRLAQEKIASMCCTAAIGAGDDEILKITQNAEKILAIDGCDKDCARIILQKAGFTNVHHLRLDTLGMIKMESPLTEDRVQTVMKSARLMLES